MMGMAQSRVWSVTLQPHSESLEQNQKWGKAYKSSRPTPTELRPQGGIYLLRVSLTCDTSPPSGNQVLKLFMCKPQQPASYLYVVWEIARFLYYNNISKFIRLIFLSLSFSPPPRKRISHRSVIHQVC